MPELAQRPASTFTLRGLLGCVTIVAILLGVPIAFERARRGADHWAVLQAVKQGRLSEAKGRAYLGDREFERLWQRESP